MKNRLIISFLFSCFLAAAPVEIDKAERVAGNIFIERSNTGIREDFSVRSVDIIEDENAIKLIYVFQLEDDGFIMVSADDEAVPLLAYSFESPFEIENMPSNLSWLMDTYKQIITNVIELDESPTEEVYAKWQKYITGEGLNRNRDIKGPLLLSHWNQSGSWNDYCPGETSCSSDQVPSGCVAVAMSAIMHYWEYPKIGYGSNSCYCGGWGTQYADFSNAYYDYEAMGSAEAGSDAASLLVWHAGVAVNMDYDCEGSGAQVTGG